MADRFNKLKTLLASKTGAPQPTWGQDDGSGKVHYQNDTDDVIEGLEKVDEFMNHDVTGGKAAYGSGAMDLFEGPGTVAKAAALPAKLKGLNMAQKLEFLKGADKMLKAKKAANVVGTPEQIMAQKALVDKLRLKDEANAMESGVERMMRSPEDKAEALNRMKKRFGF